MEPDDRSLLVEVGCGDGSFWFLFVVVFGFWGFFCILRAYIVYLETGWWVLLNQAFLFDLCSFILMFSASGNVVLENGASY